VGASPRRAGAGGSSGFTLIEVVVSVLIVAVGLTAILQGLTITARSASSQPQRTRATFIAKESLDRLLLRSGHPEGLRETGERTTAEGTFRWETTTERHEPGFPLDEGSLILKCTVTVTWEARGGVTERVTLETLELGSTQ
jgi:prepilin-type N-terminal cleavage/methylation domain-containing protein